MANYHSYNSDRTQKICASCKVMQDFGVYRIREKKYGRGKGKYYNNTCKSCEHNQIETYRNMTLKGVAAEIVRRKKHECLKHNLPFDLTVEWVAERLQAIDFRCELTGLPMRVFKLSIEEQYVGFHLDAVSVDRIIHDGGYTKDNIRFILNQVNVFRSNASDERMYEIAQALIIKKDSK